MVYKDFVEFKVFPQLRVTFLRVPRIRIVK